MVNKSFSLKIGHLIFEKKALSYMLFGFFLLGVLVGLASIIYINHPAISFAVILPLLVAMVLPAIIFSKGVRKAKEVSERT